MGRRPEQQLTPVHASLGAWQRQSPQQCRVLQQKEELSCRVSSGQLCRPMGAPEQSGARVFLLYMACWAQGESCARQSAAACNAAPVNATARVFTSCPSAWDLLPPPSCCRRPVCSACQTQAQHLPQSSPRSQRCPTCCLPSSSSPQCCPA